jgi:hypothetical protein
MPLWMRLEETDYALQQAGVFREERERLVSRMAEYEKAQKGEGRERADWETDMYPVALVKAEKVANRFYRDAAALTGLYGKPTDDGSWLNDKGDKVYPDWPEDEHQWSLTFEVLDGEKKGDWLWVFASPRFGMKRDGQWFGKLAAIIGAIDAGELPDMSTGDTGPWALTAEGSLDEFFNRPLRASVEPKPDPQYAKVLAWAAVKKGEKYAAPKPAAKDSGTADPAIGDEDIPF